MPRNRTIAKETIGHLIAKFPAAFTDGEPRRPLKIGFDQDLRRAWPELDPRHLHVALAHLRGFSCLPAGAVRLGCGTCRCVVIEAVTPEAAKHAVQRSADMRAKRAAKKTAAAAAAEVAKAPDRIAALRMFHEAGIFTWVSLEPTLDVEASLAIVEATMAFWISTRSAGSITCR
jgi:sRNA-binding protein